MSKISQYTAISNVQTDDLLVVVDVHDTSMAPTGTDKKMALSQLPFDASGAAVAALTSAEAYTDAETTRAEAAEALLAPLASPALTGSPTAPTKSALTNSTDIATTAYADSAVAVETSRAETAEAAKLPLDGGTMTGYLAPAVVTLSQSGGSVAVNAALGNDFSLTLTASGWTISNPSSPVDGQKIILRLIQDATGSRTVTWGDDWYFGGAGAPVLSTTAAAVDILGFIYDASVSQWIYAGAANALQQVATFNPQSPQIYGLSMWTIDPKICAAGCIPFQTGTTFPALVNEIMYASAALAATSETIGYLGTWVATAGTTPGSGVNRLAIFDSAGTLLGQTGDMTSDFESPGYVEGAISGGVPVTAGDVYYLTILSSFTGTALAVAQFGASLNIPRIRSVASCIGITGQATVPSSFDPATAGLDSGPVFVTAGT